MFPLLMVPLFLSSTVHTPPPISISVSASSTKILLENCMDEIFTNIDEGKLRQFIIDAPNTSLPSMYTSPSQSKSNHSLSFTSSSHLSVSTTHFGLSTPNIDRIYYSVA